VRTRLSLLTKPERDKAKIKQAQYFRGKHEIDFRPEDIVYIRDYKHPAKSTWRKAVIKDKLGNKTYVRRWIPKN